MFRRALMQNHFIYGMYGYRFENEGVSDNSSWSVFQFLVRYICIKCEKIKRLYACYIVESWIFRMF